MLDKWSIFYAKLNYKESNFNKLLVSTHKFIFIFSHKIVQKYCKKFQTLTLKIKLLSVSLFIDYLLVSFWYVTFILVCKFLVESAQSRCTKLSMSLCDFLCLALSRPCTTYLLLFFWLNLDLCRSENSLATYIHTQSYV